MDADNHSALSLEFIRYLSPGERLAIASTLLLASGALTIASGGTLAPGLLGAWQAIGLIGGVHGAALGVAGVGISFAGLGAPHGITPETLKAFKSTAGVVMSPLGFYKAIESPRKIFAPRPDRFARDWFQAVSSELIEQLLTQPQGTSEPSEFGPLGHADSIKEILERAEAALVALEAAQKALEQSQQTS